MKDPHPLIATAVAYLASYDYHIRYIPGKFLPDVDALSRLHIEDSSSSDCEESSFDIDEFINVITNSHSVNVSNNDKPSLDINAFINVLTRSKTQELKKTDCSCNPEPAPQNTHHPNDFPNTVRVNNFDKEKLIKAQMNDPFLKQITLSLLGQAPLLRQTRHFTLDNGLLYFTGRNDEQIAVPQNVLPFLLKSYHDDMGHYAFRKTYNTIKQKYWSKNLLSDVKTYCKTCMTCAQLKNPPRKIPGLLKPITARHIWDVVVSDLFSISLPSKSKNGPVKTFHVALFVDVFSRYLVTYSFNTPTANNLIY